jgi:hypothetical protein
VRQVLLCFALVWVALAATVRLYLKDGSYQLVREYRVVDDRVRYFSVERSEWEEIPLSLVDLKRTEAEYAQRQEALRKDAEEVAAEEKFEREQRREADRVPPEAGVYLVAGEELRPIKAAPSKVVTSKARSVLKVLSPVPVITGKATVELEGERSANLAAGDRPEFYVRLAGEERFGIVRLGAKKGARVVQRWTIIPVSKELIEEQQDVEVFRRQVGDGLYKIWPVKPLEPGEYAVVQYTQGKGNAQVWDFAWRPNPGRG